MPFTKPPRSDDLVCPPRRRRGRALVALGGAAALVLTGVLAVPAAAANLPGSNFEIDTNANLKVDGPAPAIDWASVNENRKPDLQSGAGDDSFGNGTKEDTAVPSVVDGSIPPNKSDLLNFGVYRETVGTTDFLHLFWHRVQEPNGTTNMDFEFNQSPTISGNNVTPVRTEGDLLIQYDLSQGGTNPVLFVAYWLTDASFNPPYQNPASAVTPANCVSSNSFPCWGLRTNLSAASLATGSINTTAIPAGEADGLGAISARTFGEASINFTTLLGTQGCTSFGSAYLKSRSSDSFTAALKDFIAPTAVNISNCAKVIIRKQTDPDGATTSFGYTKTFTTAPTSVNTFSLADGGVQTYNGVFFGTGLKVTEDVIPAGWKFDHVDCSASTGVTPSISGAEVTFDLNAATDILDCTYFNETGGAVIIRKATDPSPDPSDSSFGFSSSFDRLSGANDPSFSLKDGEDSTYTDVLLGTGYTVTEDTLPTGWSLESINCDASSGVTPNIDLVTGTVTFDIDDADDLLDCTYGNETGGQVIIRKVTQPSPDASDTSFDYSTVLSTLGGDVDPTFSLKDQGSQSYDNVLFGSGLNVTEGTLPPGWELVDVDCSESSGVIPSIVGASITFTIDDSEDLLDCTYTNRASGSIVVEKVTDTGDGSFDFTSNTLTPSAFTLTTTAPGDAGKDSETFSDLDPGIYDVAETVPDYWNLVSATCDDGSDPAAIGLSPGETVTCTFHDEREVGSIEITKTRKHAADGLGANHPHAGVDFVITGGELPAEGIIVTTDANGVACATGLLVSGLAGLYTVEEVVPDGYVMEIDGTQTANVAEASALDCSDANGGAKKSFNNIPLTKITVSVDSLIDGGTFSTIDCYVTGTPDGVMEVDGITDEVDDISLELNNLEPQHITCDFVIDP
ncbi:prealbumin-like fold domain-containing protein [Agromyces sp. NPDC004153]